MKTNAFNKKVLIAVLTMVMVLCLVLAACTQPVTIIFNIPTDTLSVGGQTSVTAIASNGESCTISVDKPDIVEFDEKTGILKVIGDVTADTAVTITATLPSNTAITATKSILIKASTSPSASGTIVIGSDITIIDRNTPATLTFKDSEGKDYKIPDEISVSVSDKTLVYFNSANKKLVVFGSASEATEVTVTAVLVADKTVTASKKFTVTPEKATPKITISAKDRIAYGDAKSFITVKVTGGAEYTLSCSSNLVSIDKDNYITVAREPEYDTTVTVVATVKDNPDIKASKKILVKAPRKDNVVNGSNGLTLTNAMLQAIGNASITVTGAIKDVYNDYNVLDNSYVHEYESVVKMSDDKWIGSWNVKGSSNVTCDAYQQGTETHTIVTADNEEVVQHVMERVYIDKNNTVAYKVETDYRSIPFMWEEQHLWNHLGTLTTDSFEFDSENEVFHYILDSSNLDVAYFMEYLKYSFTPILTTDDGSLSEVYLVVKNGAVVGLKARTVTVYYGSETAENASGESYVEIDLTFSDVGTTDVPDPTAYTAPQNADKLQAAINKMKTATNYTFSATDTTTYAPVTDPGDYELSASASSGITTMSVSKNHTSASGTVGLVGKITADSILLERTGMYTSTMDDKPYWRQYSGYKKNSDNTYDYFEYSSSKGEFEGKRKISGSITDVLPTWDFSANVFEFVTSNATGGRTTYTFRLRDAAATGELAMEVSMHSSAKDGEASADNRFTIVVDGEGNVVSTVYPYSSVSGTYRGYITTTYTNVGSTAIDAKEFEQYIPRVISANWADYDLMHYHPNHTTQESGTATAEDVLKVMFGTNASKFPPMTVFSKAFDDDISGPFYDWKDSTGANGETIYHEVIDLTARTDDFDENGQISNETYDRIVKTLGDALKEYGFEISVANTSPAHTLFDRTTRYVTFINAEYQMQITVENNHTKNFWIYFYNVGTWILK